MGQPVRHQHFPREDPDTAENIAEIFLYMCKGIKHNVGQLSVVFYEVFRYTLGMAGFKIKCKNILRS